MSGLSVTASRASITKTNHRIFSFRGLGRSRRGAFHAKLLSSASEDYDQWGIPTLYCAHTLLEIKINNKPNILLIRLLFK
ncbi:hypothetical protein PEDI_39780 [Persicobacter diffluens]|uniref:Uncharacterized protein n=1 Tax=Persicobacter diffluens TaxID=981 RepID=A0AAN4W0J5_9BACT|nr:hypothetical protein PEDI_39780 [Persicobacter diffluens]